MKKHFKLSFFTLAALFILHQILQKVFNLSLPFVDSFFDPFCFIAISLPLVQFERTILYKQEHLSGAEAFIIFVILALVSELVLPLVSTQFIYDPLDFLAMFLGFAWFILLRNFRPFSLTETSSH